MKKLTTEEKAKAYDKAIERAKRMFSEKEVKYLFPALKEDDDERIRKILRERIIRYDPNNEILIKEEGISQKQFLDWFERQGEHKKFRDGIQVGDKVTRNRDGMLVNLSQLNRVAKKDEKQGEQKPTEWNPQPGDTFRKKGTISPTYHLCNKREDGITFGFVENNEVGISGGEITIFALRNDYELVERLKPIEKVVEEEFNKVICPNNAWSEEDEKILEDIKFNFEYNKEKMTEALIAQYNRFFDKIKSLKPQPKQEWSEEDEKTVHLACEFIRHHSRKGDSINGIDCNELVKMLKSLKDRVQTQNLTVTDEELAQAKKDAYNDALDKLEYHSDTPTFDDGWDAAIWYLKKRNIQLQPKQEWSEEDNEQYNRALYMMEQLELTESWDDVYNWLKSIKERIKGE